jgi:hypothetical protein
MRIMAGQSDNRVGSIKLPDGQYTQSGRQALKELHRVHFPKSAEVEVTGAAKLESICSSQGLKGKWLKRSMINLKSDGR